MAHSKLFSPSASHRWLACYGSAKRNAEIPGTTNAAAEEGTLLHEVCESINLGIPEPPDLSKWELTDDQEELVHSAIQMAKDIRSSGAFRSTLWKEAEAAIPEMPEIFGTVDLAMYDTEAEHLVIADYKFGFTDVDIDFNPQLMIYAYAVMLSLGLRVQSLTLAIIQPKSSSKPKMFTLTKAELQNWVNDNLIPAYQAIKAGNDSLTPGEEQCRWCLSKADPKDPCPAIQKEIMDALSIKEPFETKDLSQLLKMVPAMRSFATAVESAALAVLNQGGEVKGFKLVRGRANRRWALTEEETAKWLAKRGLKEKERYNYKVISPAQAEKKINVKSLSTKLKNAFDKMVEKPEGKLTYAHEGDKRPAVEVNIVSELNEAAVEEGKKRSFDEFL
jgi:hypothetical protein